MTMAAAVILATLTPATAVHRIPDDERLHSAVPLTELIDREVETLDGRVIGELRDVLLTDEGRLAEYLIHRAAPGDAWNRGATEFADDVANYDQPPFYDAESEEGELELKYVAAAPQQLTFEENSEVVRINLGPEGYSGLPQRDARRFSQREQVRGSEIIGMEVDLLDADSFGSVEDILLADGEVVAYVVDNWDGLDKQRRALPVEVVGFRRAEREEPIRQNYGVEEVEVALTREQIGAVPEFELD